MAGELWEPIQEYINALNDKDSMPAVHHYTTIKGALGILESGRMRLTERPNLNDPSELSHGIVIAQATLSQLGRKQDEVCLGARRRDRQRMVVGHDPLAPRRTQERICERSIKTRTSSSAHDHGMPLPTRTSGRSAAEHEDISRPLKSHRDCLVPCLWTSHV
jgi:hypothetical protein